MSNTSHSSGDSFFEEWEELGEHRVVLVDYNELVVWERLTDYPHYAVIGRFFVGDAGPQLIGLSFRPWSDRRQPPPILTTVMCRKAPIDLLYERVRFFVANHQALSLDLDVDVQEFSRHPRPGRGGRPDVFYARLAAQYVEVLTMSSSPTRDLAERIGFSASSTRDFLHQARLRGLLTKSVRGIAGGELTEKAIRLLRADGPVA